MADAFTAWKKKTYFYHDLGAQSRVFGYTAMQPSNIIFKSKPLWIYELVRQIKIE